LVLFPAESHENNVIILETWTYAIEH